jgi:hypothetical protein
MALLGGQVVSDRDNRDSAQPNKAPGVALS